jgi:hypothetical protein
LLARFFFNLLSGIKIGSNEVTSKARSVFEPVGTSFSPPQLLPFSAFHFRHLRRGCLLKTRKLTGESNVKKMSVSMLMKNEK